MRECGGGAEDEEMLKTALKRWKSSLKWLFNKAFLGSFFLFHQQKRTYYM